MQNGGDFVYVILLYIGPLIQLIRVFGISGPYTYRYRSSCTYTDCRTAGLLTVSQYASGRYCDRLARSRFSIGFLDCRADAELVCRLHVASLASHASLPAITLLPSQYLLTSYLLTSYLVTSYLPSYLLTP
jgi:hypothetical protein